MTTFDNRRDEVSGIVAEFIVQSELWVGQQPEPVRAAASVKAKAEQDAFKRNVPDYFDIRDVELTELIANMAAYSDPERDADDAWRPPVAQLATMAEQKLGGILTGLTEPTKLAVGRQWGISSSEKVFNDGLAAVGIAAAWEVIAIIRRDDFAFATGMKAQWELLKAKGVEIFQKASPYAARIAHVLETSPGGGVPVTELGSEAADIQKVVDRAGSASEKLGDLRGAAESAFADFASKLDGVERFQRDWQLTIEQARSDVAMLRGLQAAEIDALHRVFKDRRREAQAHKDDPSHRKIERVISDAKSKWSSWSGGLPAEGMRRDADELVVELVKQLTARLDQSRADQAAFESQWEGIFLGSVSDDSVEWLASDEDWDDLRRIFVDARSPDVLKRVRQLVDDMALDLGRLLDALAAAIDARPAAADSDSDRKAFADLVAKQRSELLPRFTAARAALDRTCDDGYAVLGGSELAAVMDRRDVIASLKS